MKPNNRLSTYFTLGVGTIFITMLLSGCGGGGGGGNTMQTPAAPTGLTVSLTTVTNVDLTWTDNAGNENGFKVEKSSDNINYLVVATLVADTTSYSDTSITTENTYYYRVKAYNNDGDSSASNEVMTTTYTLSGITNLINAPISSINGDEVPSYVDSGSGLTVTYIGFALCLPGNPYAPPAAPATPPNNIYGCQNTFTTTLTAGGINTISISFTIPKIFIDFSVTSIATGTDEAYIEYTDTVITLIAQLTSTSDGRRQIGNIIGPNSITYAAGTFNSNDTILNLLFGTIIGLISTQFDDQLQAVINDQFTPVFISTLPPYIP